MAVTTRSTGHGRSARSRMPMVVFGNAPTMRLRSSTMTGCFCVGAVPSVRAIPCRASATLTAFLGDSKPPVLWATEIDASALEIVA